MVGFSIRRALTIAAGLCGLVLCAAPSDARADTNLILCNKTGARIYAAIAYQDAQTGRWIMSAWHTREPGRCESFGNVKSGLFYYFAEKEGRTAHWPSADSVDKVYCVPPTRVKREMAGSGCAPGERSLGFRGRVMDPGTYTVSFR